jgi:hypothetical protein
MKRYAYLTDTKTWVAQFNGEQWQDLPSDFQEKCLANIASHKQPIHWRSNRVAEFYMDESGLTNTSTRQSG